MTKARDLSKLLSTANGKIAGANLDVSFENITDTGTEGTKVATGTSAERGSTAGQLRFNTTTGLAEYYTGSAFKSIDAPPTVSSIDVTEVDSQAGGNQTIVITGSGFNSGATVTFVGASGTDFNASTVTVDSDTQITAVAPKSSFLNAQEPYGVKVENTSGLSATLASQINVDTAPSWSTASGSLGTFNNYETVNVSVTATDVDGDTITYSVQSGSLPSGLSLNSSTGAITGTVGAVASATTSNFTIRATANTKTSDRSFSMVAEPVIQAFTSSGTWNVPIGLTSATILVVAGGGAGGTTASAPLPNRGAGGGAGGLIYIPTWDLTGSSSYSVTIGNGGAVSSSNSTSGQNTTISGGSKTLTALGGGHGAFSDSTNNHESGGSGGGGWYPGYAGRSATQPSNTSDGVNTYNSTGFGNAGGTSGNSDPYGAGGGGAGGVGESWTNGKITGSLGGAGKDYSSVFGTSYGESGWFASGGTSANIGAPATQTGAPLGGGGNGYNNSTNTPSNADANGQANTGGGGGSGGNGGSGVVLIKY
jgi:hypothetical protein